MSTKSILKIFFIGMAVILVGVNFLLGSTPNKVVGATIGSIGVLIEIAAVVMLFLPKKISENKK